jgi:hypothetical protein
LRAGQAADLRCPGARGDRRVEAVDVDAQVHGSRAELVAHLVHQRGERAVPALVRLHHAEPLRRTPVEVVRRVPGAAQPDLRDAVAGEQAFLDRPPERRAVRDRLTEHVLVAVGVRVHMDEPDRAVAAHERAQDRQHDRVVTPERERDRPRADDPVVGVLDDLDRRLEVVGVDRHVAEIADDEAVERCRARRHVVRPQQRRLRADRTRSVPRAGPVRRPDVEGHTDEGDVEGRGIIERRQAHHRRGPTEPRHLVATQRLRARAVGHQQRGR